MHITRLDHGRSKHSNQWTISFLVQVSNTHSKKYGSWAVPVRWKNRKTLPNANFIFSVRGSGFGPYFWARPFKSVTAIMIAKSEHCKNLEVESWIKKIRFFFFLQETGYSFDQDMFLELGWWADGWSKCFFANVYNKP